MKLHERTKKQIYGPVFLMFGLTFMLVLFLLAKRAMNRGSGETPKWAQPYERPGATEGKEDGAVMPASFPPIKVDKIEKRRYRRKPSQTLRRPPSPTQ